VKLLHVAPHYASLVPAESYVSCLDSEQPDHEAEPLVVGPIPNLDKQTKLDWPHRVRKRMREGSIYMLAIVVGERSWLRNDSYASLNWLRYRSLSIAHALRLQFCTILWRVCPLAREAEVARISAHPQGAHINSHLGIVAESLVELLVNRA
jgi:hypothetical protein